MALDYLSEANFNSASGPSTRDSRDGQKLLKRSAVALALRLIDDLGKCGLPSLNESFRFADNVDSQRARRDGRSSRTNKPIACANLGWRAELRRISR